MYAAANRDSAQREIVALFDDENALDDAVEDLQIVGFGRDKISVLPPWKTVERQIGRKLKTVPELSLLE